MAESKDANLKRELGISRRDLLRRGAVVGGTLLWATPVIQSIGGRALGAHNTYSSCFECSGADQQCHQDHFTQGEAESICSAQGLSLSFYQQGEFNCINENCEPATANNRG
jgi:hypothetical protein